MTQQTEAQRLAYLIGCYCPSTNATSKAAAMLVRQDELLEQALEALELNCSGHTEGKAKDAITAIRALKGKQ